MVWFCRAPDDRSGRMGLEEAELEFNFVEEVVVFRPEDAALADSCEYEGTRVALDSPVAKLTGKLSGYDGTTPKWDDVVPTV